jgi:hypothetical protein
VLVLCWSLLVSNVSALFRHPTSELSCLQKRL